ADLRPRIRHARQSPLRRGRRRLIGRGRLTPRDNGQKALSPAPGRKSSYLGTPEFGSRLPPGASPFPERRRDPLGTITWAGSGYGVSGGLRRCRDSPTTFAVA